MKQDIRLPFPPPYFSSIAQNNLMGPRNPAYGCPQTRLEKSGKEYSVMEIRLITQHQLF